MRTVLLSLLLLLLLAVPAQAYEITGPDRDGRHSTVNQVFEYRGFDEHITRDLEVHLLYWGYPGGHVLVRDDGSLTMSLDATRYNPAFSGLVAHELGHVLGISTPGLHQDWRRLMQALGYGDIMTDRWDGANWYRNPEEAFAENVRRAFYWPWYSDQDKPQTQLAWLSRAEMTAFLAKQGIEVQW